ncbi:hypothetical protein [Limobrevibacterium gyesilva]|uniref:Uncharacterized protein n=1 Tax=Limobrevibacterium gyesilva TaxID=2991712 RepID=A0AA42CE25_9PROT|nr:hypothetical protein [Limobrevibacterium gyesilva]MCW3474724.1 hypothetical protein [Limobrevibacterium gyesilva]
MTAPSPPPIDRADVILAVNRALWGEVMPVMRAVQVAWTAGHLELHFFIDGEVPDEARDSARVVAEEMVADFPFMVVAERCIRLDAPAPVPHAPGWHTVYARKER